MAARPRPGAVLLLTVLGVAAVVAAFPEYWDYRAVFELLRRHWEQRARYAFSAGEAAAERRRVARERKAAAVAGRVTNASVRGIPDFFVQDLALQPDGKVVVAGYHNEHGIGIVRLRADGELDRGFSDRANAAAPDVTGTVEQVTVAPDATLFAAGQFRVHGSPRMVLRFQSDGTLDADFLDRTQGLPVPSHLQAPRVVVEKEGAILVFQFGVDAAPIRLARDGRVDRGWNGSKDAAAWAPAVAGADGSIAPLPPPLRSWTAIAVRQESIGPTLPFLRTRAMSRNPSEPGAPAVEEPAEYLGTRSDGRVLAIVDRAVGDDPPRYEPHLVSVGHDGRFRDLMQDAPPCNAHFSVRAIAFQGDGGTILTGHLPLPAHGTECEPFVIWRIGPDGALDRRFRMTSAREMAVDVGGPAGAGRPAAAIHRIVDLGGRGILVGGYFTSFQGQRRVNLARLRPDGVLD